MNICIVSNHFHPVALYGGTERIVEWQIECLRSLNHVVTLIALPGSKLPGVDIIEADSKETALKRIPKCDIVHFHGWFPSKEPNFPYLYTLHGNEPQPDTLPSFTACISQDHATRHGKTFFIYNGVSPNEVQFSEQKSDSLLFFSKIRRRNKGARRAVDLCSRHGIPLTLAGGHHGDLVKVGAFWKTIKNGFPVLGQLGGSEKALAFSNAKALLFPIEWQEPFGLVLIESLLAGTPVIATPYGSVTELIPSAVGATFQSDNGFAAAVERIGSIKPRDCQEYALTYFSPEKMTQTYLDIYVQILDGVPADALVGSTAVNI